MSVHPLDQWVLERLTGEVLLGDRRHQEPQEFLGVITIICLVQYSCPGYHNETAWAVVSQEMVPCREILAVLLDEPVQIVVIDQPNVDFASGSRRDNRSVLRVLLGIVGFQTGQKLSGLVLAPSRAHCCNHSLERCVCRSPTYPTFPPGVCKVLEIRREVGF